MKQQPQILLLSTTVLFYFTIQILEKDNTLCPSLRSPFQTLALFHETIGSTPRVSYTGNLISKLKGRREMCKFRHIVHKTYWKRGGKVENIGKNKGTNRRKSGEPT